MMSNETTMILEVWELLKETVTEKHRGDAAVRLLKIMDDHGFSDKFGELRGEDKWIDDALLDYIDDEVEEEEDEYGYSEDD